MNSVPKTDFKELSNLKNSIARLESMLSNCDEPNELSLREDYKIFEKQVFLNSSKIDSDSSEFKATWEIIVESLEFLANLSSEFNPASVDIALVAVSFASISWKADEASNIPAKFCFSNTNIYLDAILKIGRGVQVENLRKEFRIMHELYGAHPSHFIRPYTLLFGERNQIKPDKQTDLTVNEYFNCSAIAMERGRCNLRDYLSDPKVREMTNLLNIAKSLLEVVCKAIDMRFVMLDIKLENFVRVMSERQTDFLNKAIDFDSVVKEGENLRLVKFSTTEGYVSPEIARLLLDSSSSTPVLADSKNSVFSLGLLVFEMFNGLKSFWSSCVKAESEFVQFSAFQLTDQIVKDKVDRAFPNATHDRLRAWLSSALACDAFQRGSAHTLLHDRSFFLESVSLDFRAQHVSIVENLNDIKHEIEGLSEILKVQLDAHFGKIEASVNGLTSVVSGAAGSSKEACAMLKQLLDSTHSFTSRCGSTSTKASVIDNLSRWQDEVDSSLIMSTNEALNANVIEILGKCDDDCE